MSRMRGLVVECAAHQHHRCEYGQSAELPDVLAGREIDLRVLIQGLAR